MYFLCWEISVDTIEGHSHAGDVWLITNIRMALERHAMPLPLLALKLLTCFCLFCLGAAGILPEVYGLRS